MRLTPDSESLAEFNSCHNPEDGRFCSAPEAGGSGGGTSAMLRDYDAATFPHPFNNRERLTGETVGVELYPRGANVRISAIASYGERGKGAASRALRQITDLADRHGVTLELGAKPYPAGGAGKPLSATQLKRWYARHGFVPARRDAPGEMVRTPNP